MIFHGNIEDITEKNTFYRKVLFTSPSNIMQLVVMSLEPQQEIGMEVHHDHDQFIRVETGYGKAVIKNMEKIEEYKLSDGFAVIIPAGTWHNIINLSTIDNMKLYTIYSPPEHKDKLIQVKKPIEKDVEKKEVIPEIKNENTKDSISLANIMNVPNIDNLINNNENPINVPYELSENFNKNNQVGGTYYKKYIKYKKKYQGLRQ